MVLCDLAGGEGITWLSSETIVVARRGGRIDRGMWQVSSAGGELKPFSRIDSANGENLQWSPRVVAGGKYVLYTSFAGSLVDNYVGVVEAATGKARTIKSLRGTYVLGYVDGRVIYVRTDGVVLAAPLDLANGAAGEPVPLMDSVAVALNIATAALSPSGDLAYVRGGGRNRVALVDQAGATRPLIEEERGYLHPSVSPDGQTVALTLATPGGSDLWLYSIRSRTLDRVTTEGTNDRAVWMLRRLKSPGARLRTLSPPGRIPSV